MTGKTPVGLLRKAPRDDAPKSTATAATMPNRHAVPAARRADESFNSFAALKRRGVADDIIELIKNGPPTATGRDGQPLGRGGIDFKVISALVRAGFSDAEIKTAYLLGNISADAASWPRGFDGDIQKGIDSAREKVGTVVPDEDHMARGRTIVEHTRPNLLHWRDDFQDYQDGRYVPVAETTIKAETYKLLEKCQRHVKVGKVKTVAPFNPNIKSVAETTHAIKAVTHVKPDLNQPVWLDGRTSPDPMQLVSFSNGILNLDSNEFTSPDPNLFTASAARYPYDPNAPEPENFKSFVHEVFAGEQDQIDSLQEWFGYCLGPDVSQEKAAMLLGDKRSGKDTLRHCLESSLPEGAICGPTLDSLGTNFGMSQLIAKSLAVVGDSRIGGKCDRDLLAENVLKLTGRSLFTIDRKFKSHWTGTLPCKLLIISNERPALKDTSGALASRFIVFRTRASFYGREDPNLFRDKLKPELPGILLWALHGLRRMRERGRLLEPASSVAEREQLAREGSPVLAFVQECLTLDAGASEPKDAVHAAYNTWAAANGLFSKSKAMLFRDLQTATGGRVSEKRGGSDGKRVQLLAGAALKRSGASDEGQATPKKGAQDEIPF